MLILYLNEKNYSEIKGKIEVSLLEKFKFEISSDTVSFG